MVKFDGIRMADLLEVQDPDKDGGMTLVFKENKFLHVKIVDGKEKAKAEKRVTEKDGTNQTGKPFTSP